MNNDKRGCRSREEKAKREVCRRPNKHFDKRSSDCRRCAHFFSCEKRIVCVIDGVELTKKEFSNFFGG